MKKQLKNLAGISMLMTLALTGCGDGDSTPGSQAAYQQGSNRCSERFISDYNDLLRIFKQARSESEVDAAQNAANQFASTYKDVVCQAVLLDGSNKEVMVNVNETAALWNKAIADYRTKHFSNASGQQQPAPAPSYDQAPSASPSTGSSSLSNGITLQIHDTSAFNPAHERGTEVMVIQNGRLVSSSERDFDSPYCDILYFDQDTGVHAGDQVKLIALNISEYTASFKPASYSFALMCSRALGSNVPLTINMINQIMGSLATASNN